MNLSDIATIAHQKSVQYLNANGENPMGCGFAWVVVKGARGKKATALKEIGFKKRYDGPGLSLWNPGTINTQDMMAKSAGAEAAAEALREMGYDAKAYNRLD